MSRALPAIRDTFDIYMKEVGRVPVLSRQEEQELALRYYEDGDLEAAQRLVVSNLRFVVKVAHRYRSYGFKLEDLVQEGNIGLMQAVRRFNPHKGYRLISYGVWWIKAYIQAFIIRSWSLVKLGTTQAQKKLFFKLRRTREELVRVGEGRYETSDLAAALEVTEEQANEMEMRLAARDFSLHASVDDSSETTHIEMLESDDPDQERQVIEAEAQELVQRDIQAAIASLDDRERYIVEQRLMADDPLTLREIGERYGVSRERARQVETGVKKKIRAHLAAHTLSPELLPA